MRQRKAQSVIGLVLVLLSAEAVTYGGGLSDERHDGNWWQTTSCRFKEPATHSDTWRASC